MDQPADQEPGIVALDAVELERWLNDPAVTIVDVMADLPFLRTETQARAYISYIRESLEDLKQGRCVSHEQVAQDVADRRNRYRATAAE